MSDFALDPRLLSDGVVIAEMDISFVLLMNNSLVPWFVLVPRTDEIELIDLSMADQLRVLDEINLLSVFIKSYFGSSKLNIAVIGSCIFMWWAVAQRTFVGPASSGAQ